MVEIFKTILVGLIVVTSVACATGLQELTSDATDLTKDKPVVTNPVPNPMRYSSFESFSAKSSSENYKLTGAGMKLFGKSRLASEEYQWEDPVFSLTKVVQ